MRISTNLIQALARGLCKCFYYYSLVEEELYGNACLNVECCRHKRELNMRTLKNPGVGMA